MCRHCSGSLAAHYSTTAVVSSMGPIRVLALLPASGLRTVVAQANHVTELTGGSRSRRTRPSRAAIVAGSTAVQLASNRPCTGHQTD